MKKKSASRSAFFNIRVLIGVFILAAGALLALASSGVFSVAAQSVIQTMTHSRIITYSTDPLVPVGFDCSKVYEMGIDKQENFRAGAIMVACGEVPGVATSATSTLGPIGYFIKKLLMPLAYGSADVNLITGTETSPDVTQSETFSAVNPDDPNQVFVAYNDSRGRFASPINISGASISTDGGTTFTRITTAGGQSPFAATVGDPVALYNKPTGTWFTVWLDTACGTQGLGGYKSATPANAASWTHFCIHNSSGDDRESGWADNNPASPFYGRMYISWGNGGALSATYSSDNGLTWHAPIQVAPASPFIRDVQITGDLSGNGVLYIAGMNEGGGGFPHNDVNHIFKSTDGGNTWTHPYTGPAFPGPGVTAVGYFACMFSDGGGYWRHEGWGQPAALNNVVHLVYAQHGTGADPGDVYYIRSTDGGVTFATPFKLNTDATIRPQWQPNLSVSPTGSLLATWYDARESASCTRGNPAVPCYRMWSRKSSDNGTTWLPDDAFSDVVTPLPAQPDPGIQATYAGDYDYGSAVATKHVTSWTDGRVAINAASQQDAFTDREPIGSPNNQHQHQHQHRRPLSRLRQRRPLHSLLYQRRLPQLRLLQHLLRLLHSLLRQHLQLPLRQRQLQPQPQRRQPPPHSRQHLQPHPRLLPVLQRHLLQRQRRPLPLRLRQHRLSLLRRRQPLLPSHLHPLLQLQRHLLQRRRRPLRLRLRQHRLNLLRRRQPQRRLLLRLQQLQLQLQHPRQRPGLRQRQGLRRRLEFTQRRRLAHNSQRSSESWRPALAAKLACFSLASAYQKCSARPAYPSGRMIWLAGPVDNLCDFKHGSLVCMGAFIPGSNVIKRLFLPTKCLRCARTFRTLAASIQRARTVTRPLHVEASAPASEPFL